MTGGSSGIGAAIAEFYAARGANVSLIARSAAGLETRRAALQSAFGGRFRAEPADVRDARALSSAVARCEAGLGPCDVLVASAGIVEPAPFEALAADRFAAQIETNLIGAANAVRAVYGGMRARGRGRILLVGSGAGLVGIFGYTAYCASKFGLAGFAEALRQEAKPAGISVSICFPPDTDTPQWAAEAPLRPEEAHAVIGRGAAMHAGAVAKAAVEGAEKGRFAIYPDPRTALLARTRSLAAPFLDRWFDLRVARARRKPKTPS